MYRTEGITWIVKSLQNMGEVVLEMHLPQFLDQRAKEFLLSKSLKDTELQEINSMLNIQMDIYK